MGQRIPSKAVHHGYHFDQDAFRDDMNVRCSRCGFICNLERDLRSHPGGYEGWGTTMTKQTTTGYDPQHPFTVITWNSNKWTWDSASVTWDSPAAPTETNYDPLVTCGCPQCGVLLYDNPARGTRG